MVEISNEELIKHAKAVINPHDINGRLVGDVGAALATSNGNIFTGVCIDAAATGICAEHSAIAAMVTAGEYKISKIVAVWNDEKDDSSYVLPPCGKCREIIRQIDNSNLDTTVILQKHKIVRLRELLPYNLWPSEPI
jgi:cytidine deaminase